MKKQFYRSGFASSILVGVVALLIILGGVIYYTTGSDKEDTMSSKKGTEKSPAAMNSDTMVKKDSDAMMQGGEKMVKDGAYMGQVLAGTRALLLDFTKEDYEKALVSKKLIVLYFYANWCPLCKVEFPKTKSAFDKLTSDQVIGFRVNYNDDETDAYEKSLASQFGVAYQHTKVFLKDGNRVLKAPDSWDETRYLNEIHKFIMN